MHGADRRECDPGVDDTKKLGRGELILRRDRQVEYGGVAPAEVGRCVRDIVRLSVLVVVSRRWVDEVDSKLSAHVATRVVAPPAQHRNLDRGQVFQ